MNSEILAGTKEALNRFSHYFLYYQAQAYCLATLEFLVAQSERMSLLKLPLTCYHELL